MANLMSGFISKSDMRACIMGTKGNIYLNPRWHQAQSYTLELNEESKTIEKPSLGKGYSHEIEECYRCVQNGQLKSNLWSHQNSFGFDKHLR